MMRMRKKKEKIHTRIVKYWLNKSNGMLRNKQNKKDSGVFICSGVLL